MNCLEFRRALGTDPCHIDRAQRTHAVHCASCSKALGEAVVFERVLARALRGDEAPAGLIGRILDRTAEETGARPGERPTPAGRPRSRRSAGRPGWQEGSPGSKGRHWLAAASIAALAAATTLGYFLHPAHEIRASADKPAGGLERAIVRIIRTEVLTLATKGVAGPDEQRSTLEVIGLELKRPLRDVRFATNCVIRGRTAAHWVLEGARSPVTVFVMPEESLTEPERLHEGTLRGLLLPAGKGSIAVVGMQGERLEELGRRVRAALAWPA